MTVRSRLVKKGIGMQMRVMLIVLAMAGAAAAADQPMWGRQDSRNMVSDETGLPDTCDPKTGANVKWSVALGTAVYSTPVIGGGKVIIGTNNDVSPPRDPRHRGDRGVLVCLSEKDGSLCWQLVVPKLKGMLVDAGGVGLVSPATIEGDRAYVVTNRNEVACLDLAGLANGNDGPFKDEARHQAPPDEPPIETGNLDADILWLYDINAGVGVHQHDAAHGSILVHGRHLYVCTSNGVDKTHKVMTTPDAPALVVIDKITGRLAARDDERMAPRTIHCTWSSPSMGEVGGRMLVFFGGGDAYCYAFEALPPDAAPSETAKLKCVWRFDCDPAAPRQDILKFQENRKEGPSNITAMPVFDKGRVYVVAGGDYWHGKRETWLKCIDATGSGDITRTGLRWSYAVQKHGMSTPSISDGLVFVADTTGVVHCVDADTGKPYWTHDAGGEIWGSTLVADGRVYVGTHKGDLCVLAAGREKRLIASVNFGSPINSTPVAANGTLYVATMKRLYALRKPSP